MLGTAWSTSATRVALTILAQGDLPSISRAKRHRCAARSTLRTAWSTSATSVAQISPCTKLPSLNVEGIKTAASCKQHAKDGIIDVQN